MEQPLTEKESLLFRRCDEVLHYLWDPIGVADCPPARNEYETYVPSVFERLMMDKPDQTGIEEYLISVERKWMGLTPNAPRAREIAELLIDWRDEVFE